MDVGGHTLQCGHIVGPTKDEGSLYPPLRDRALLATSQNKTIVLLMVEFIIMEKILEKACVSICIVARERGSVAEATKCYCLWSPLPALRTFE